MDIKSTDFLLPGNFLLLGAVFFVIIFLRYLLISAGFHYVIHRIFKRQFSDRILNHDRFSNHQMIREITWSAFTSMIFAISACAMVIAWQQDWTQLYIDWYTFPIWYLPLSLFAALFIHDTYYYFLHRWMHLSRTAFLYVHKVHHDSIITNAMTSFSFHPLESIFQAAIIPVIIFLLPMHLGVLLILLFLMTISGTINHAGAELYSKNGKTHWFWKWIIGAAHHDLHHKKFNHNYGLYFTFWDRWMGTEYEE